MGVCVYGLAKYHQVRPPPSDNRSSAHLCARVPSSNFHARKHGVVVTQMESDVRATVGLRRRDLTEALPAQLTDRDDSQLEFIGNLDSLLEGDGRR